MREMRSLVLLSECGSIQEVGRRCHLSPAAVHQHLKILETELGIRLYERGHGSLHLTPAGEMVLPFLKDILAGHEAAVAAMHEWKQAERGLVRVGAGPTFTTHLLPRAIKKFRRSFSGVDVFVETGHSNGLRERLQSGALDVIVDLAAEALEDPSLEQVARWEAPAGFVSARDFVPPRCRLRDLQKKPFIMFQEGSRMNTIVQHYLDELGFRPKVMMRSDSSEAIKAMVRSGLGISVLFLWNLNPESRSKTFTVVKTEAKPLVTHMALIKKKSAFTPRAVQEFIGVVRQMSWTNLKPAALAEDK